ncbi:hypothetical protein [Oleisolibacter albus]|uniref:hypothetical protein n=1 Tax=Oleisolibacter albus TaxID=2171757 RepID=UPI000DF37233|nr:hypothetical protein [Oleisolibacter albus]
MSKTVMWSEIDAKGFESTCFFNEDPRSYEVMVCATGQRLCRSDSFPANTEPHQGMAQDDLHQSITVAGRLVTEIEHLLGDH